MFNTINRNRRRTRVAQDLDMRVNQAAKTLEMRYMHLLEDKTAVTAKLATHKTNLKGQCLFDLYVDEDCYAVINRAIALVKWRKVNGKLRHKPVLEKLDFK